MKRTLLVVVLLTAAVLVAFLCHTPTVRAQEIGLAVNRGALSMDERSALSHSARPACRFSHPCALSSGNTYRRTRERRPHRWLARNCRMSARGLLGPLSHCLW